MPHFPPTDEYSTIEDTEDAENLISEISPRFTKQPRPSLSIWRTVIMLLATSLLTYFLGLCVGRRFPSSLGATQHVSKYSPILEDIDIAYDIVKFNGLFVHENIYRQNAGPDVDAAWEALGVGFRPSIVSNSLAAKSGLTKDHVQRKSKYGGGYPVFVEGLHQLHCLNLLRKLLYYNYGYYHSRAKGAFSNSERVQRCHVTHCLDFLRRHLMCTMDIGIFGSIWVDPASLRPFVDFNTKRTCRNFEAIRSWAEQNQIPEDVQADYLEVPRGWGWCDGLGFCAVNWTL